MGPQRRAGAKQVTLLDHADRLRVVIANEEAERRDELAQTLDVLGHELVADDAAIQTITKLARRGELDIALVGLGGDREHALELITKITRQPCPVIAVLDTHDREFIAEAARRGIYAYVTRPGPNALEAAIEITLRRFFELCSLEEALGRRAQIERAKGILMERHQVSEEEAFEMLRRASRQNGRKVSDISGVIEDVHRLLPADPAADSSPRARHGTAGRRGMGEADFLGEPLETGQ